MFLGALAGAVFVEVFGDTFWAGEASVIAGALIGTSTGLIFGAVRSRRLLWSLGVGVFLFILVRLAWELLISAEPF